MMEDITDRIKRVAIEERSSFITKHWHCWHSLPGYRPRWRCHCGETADLCLMDYYVKDLFVHRDQRSALH